MGMGGEGAQSAEKMWNGFLIWFGLVCDVAWIPDDKLVIPSVGASDNLLISSACK